MADLPYPLFARAYGKPATSDYPLQAICRYAMPDGGCEVSDAMAGEW